LDIDTDTGGGDDADNDQKKKRTVGARNRAFFCAGVGGAMDVTLDKTEEAQFSREDGRTMNYPKVQARVDSGSVECLQAVMRPRSFDIGPTLDSLSSSSSSSSGSGSGSGNAQVLLAELARRQYDGLTASEAAACVSGATRADLEALCAGDDAKVVRVWGFTAFRYVLREYVPTYWAAEGQNQPMHMLMDQQGGINERKVASHRAVLFHLVRKRPGVSLEDCVGAVSVLPPLEVRVLLDDLCHEELITKKKVALQTQGLGLLSAAFSRSSSSANKVYQIYYFPN
jgi:hypothetical protein